MRSSRASIRSSAVGGWWVSVTLPSGLTVRVVCPSMARRYFSGSIGSNGRRGENRIPSGRRGEIVKTGVIGGWLPLLRPKCSRWTQGCRWRKASGDRAINRISLIRGVHKARGNQRVPLVELILAVDRVTAFGPELDGNQNSSPDRFALEHFGSLTIDVRDAAVPVNPNPLRMKVIAWTSAARTFQALVHRGVNFSVERRVVRLRG